jgi:hypothetical protein
VTLLMNVALAMECEAACRQAEHWLAAGLSVEQVGVFLDAVIAMGEPVETHSCGVRNCAIQATKWFWKQR